MNNIYILFLIFGMLLTGTINTILNKYQDFVCIKNCDSKYPIYFNQPILQSLNMFIGELFCLFTFIYDWILKNNQTKNKDLLIIEEEIEVEDEIYEDAKEYLEYNENDFLININDTLPARGFKNIYILFLYFPSFCDFVSSIFMNIGLFYISASTYQILRGSIIIFTVILSVLILKHKFSIRKLTYLFIIFIGITIVGVNPYKNVTNYDIYEYIGIYLVIIAQIFSALQIVIEEKLIKKFDFSTSIVVSFEGLFGIVNIFILLCFKSFFLQFIHINFDVLKNEKILITSVCIIISTALFNWFGISITKSITATSRATIDLVKIIFIWIVSLYLGWELFNYTQMIGFIILAIGSYLYIS